MLSERRRTDAIAALLAGIKSVDPSRLIANALKNSDMQNVKLLSIGKGAIPMAMAAYKVLSDRIKDGLVVTPHGIQQSESLPSNIRVLFGGHPVPTEEGVSTASHVKRYANSVEKDEQVLCLISGGGSALMTLPVDGVALEDMQWVTKSLLRAGANIQELNCVRKHLDQLKGGRLSQICEPAQVTAFILSDVIGDPLDVISSGPTVPDPTTFVDAKLILQKFNLWESAPPSVRNYIEQGVRGEVPESPKNLNNVTVTIIGNNTIAAQGVLSELEQRGYAGEIVTTELTGEAREVGKSLANKAMTLKTGQCLIFAGETTVTVTGNGKGGRNQELALGAAIALHETNSSAVIASIGTDGIDGPTDAAGGIVDSETVLRGEEKNLDAHAFLANNDAYSFLKETGDLIIAGPTGTNVMDLQVVIV